MLVTRSSFMRAKLPGSSDVADHRGDGCPFAREMSKRTFCQMTTTKCACDRVLSLRLIATELYEVIGGGGSGDVMVVRVSSR